MGPVIKVPEDVAQRLAEETDLVEVDPVLPDAVDEIDVQLGEGPGVILLLKEAPPDRFGLLVSMITMSDYAKSAPNPFKLSVSDRDGAPHEFSSHFVNEESIRDHLKLAYFGARGDRRPLIPA